MATKPTPPNNPPGIPDRVHDSQQDFAVKSEGWFSWMAGAFFPYARSVADYLDQWLAGLTIVDAATKADKNGNATEKFKVADGEAADEAMNVGQQIVVQEYQSAITNNVSVTGQKNVIVELTGDANITFNKKYDDTVLIIDAAHYIYTHSGGGWRGGSAVIEVNGTIVSPIVQYGLAILDQTMMGWTQAKSSTSGIPAGSVSVKIKYRPNTDQDDNGKTILNATDWGQGWIKIKEARQ